MAVKGLSTLQRGLAVLEVVARRQPVAGAQIAAELDVERSALQRVLVTLADAGWLRQDPSDRSWQIGPRALYAMHTSSESQLLHRARPALASLRDRTGDTAFLALGAVPRMVVAEVAESRQLTRVVPPPGLEIDAPRSAVLLAVAAFGSEADRARLTGGADDAEALAHEIATTRARGWSSSVDVVHGGATGIASPVTDRSGHPVAAVSVCGPTERLTGDRVAEIGPLVVEATTSLSDELVGG